MGTTLADVRTNDRFEVVTVPDENTRAQLLRLGFLDGEVECRQRVRNGPVILRRNGTDLALGRGLAKEIEVEP
jgi:ferrous iron transport protein A